MAYIITEPCIGVKDLSCIEVCPVDCIHPREGADGYEAEQMIYIDSDECIDCAACEPVCPVTAIFEEEALPEEYHKYIEINKKYFA